jgi:hypothetical protein
MYHVGNKKLERMFLHEKPARLYEFCKKWSA